MDRRTGAIFVALGALAACTEPLAGPPLPEPIGKDGVLRIAAANLTSGNGQSWDLGHGARILAGLQADVALLQELRVGDGSPAALEAWVAATVGDGHAIHREEDVAIPNGVVSRYPILAAGAWDDPMVGDRELVWARIDVPGERDLWAVSVHFLSTSSSKRRAEAIALVDRVRAEVPDDDLLVIGGDLNAGSMGEQQFDVLAEVVVTDGPRPVDGDGNPNTNRSRERPYDHVLPDPDLAALAVPTVVGGHMFAAGAVIDTRVFDPIAALAPATSDDSAAPQMQHMAVIRDFAVTGLQADAGM